MSIRVMTMIWDTCLYQAGTLNVLLAMADHASDNGRDIYPGMEYLAAKCRQTVRATQDCVKRLRADRVVILLDRNGNDLEPSANPTGGRGYRAEYRIDLKRVQELQGLHQTEHPDCELCKAGNKTPQIGAKKGEAPREKGELSRSHIDRTVKEPSRPSLTTAAAVESENIASLGHGEPERWPEFRSAVAKSWPDGFPADDEVASRRQFERLTRQHQADLLIACAGLHGEELRRRQIARGSKSKQMAKRPSNWLKDGDWEGYSPMAEERARRDAETVTAVGNVRRALGDGLFDLLKRLGMPDGSLALLDGMALAGPGQFTIAKPVQRTLLEKHFGALERHFGSPPSFQQVGAQRAS